MHIMRMTMFGIKQSKLLGSYILHAEWKIIINALNREYATFESQWNVPFTIDTPTGVNPGGDGGDVSPPLFWVGGMACSPVQSSPPLFEDKIILNLTFIVKKLTFLTIKTSKNCSLAPLARTEIYSETLSLRFCQYMYSFLDIIYV